MYLSAGIIYSRLSEYFNVSYKAFCSINILVGRPIYYEEDGIAEGHICIITPDTIIRKPLDNGVYISIGDILFENSAHEIELLTVSDNVSGKLLFNTLQAIFDYYDKWERDITLIIEEDKGYRELIQVTCKCFDCPISIIDEDMRYIAYSKEYTEEFEDIIENDKISPSALIEMISNPLFEKVVEEKEIFEYFMRGELFLCYNFRKAGKYIGRVVLYCRKTRPKEMYKFLLHALVCRIEAMLRKYGSFLLEKDDYSALREIFRDLLGKKNIDKQYLNHTLSTHGWFGDDEYILIRLQPEFRHEWRLYAPYLIPLIERQWAGTCALEYSCYLLIVLNTRKFGFDNRRDFKQELAYFVRDGLMMAGVSRSFTDLGQTLDYYQQTEIAISMGMLLEPNRWCYYFDDYALRYWQKKGVSNFTPEQICSKALLKLLKHDREANAQLYQTLVALCKNNYNYSQAAKVLFIHRTTFLYRMERIVEITNLNIENSEERLYLELSYRYIEEGNENP